MTQCLPATGTQTSWDAMAKCDRRARIAERKLWTAIGFAVCPGTKGQSCFAALPVRFTTSTGHTWRGMARIKIGTRTNTVFTFSQMERNHDLETYSILSGCSAARQRLRTLPAQRTVDSERHFQRLSVSPLRFP